ncbi:protein translocase subunit SecF [uncultured Fusobacterium sp.]|uniref:protein translocase subunit SecF n=1 Tax=uncultured Fusobacterium sp. TaxID=159267 RepID=UPI0025D7844E|nr:protein translocase subunit SecF [uncultured Fusobacterium sp.]
MQIGIIKNSKKYLGLSLFLVILSLGVLIFKGLNYGIDFSGGSLIQVKFEKNITLKEINNNLDKIAKEIPQFSSNSRKVQVSEDNTVIIRTQELTEAQKADVLEELKNIGNYNLDKVDKVGASIGKELKTSAIYSLAIGTVLIILYITMRFEFLFSIGAVSALLHDIIIAVGVIALLGYEVDTPFIAAVLTILGYSINNTIVVFDRVRENLKRKTKEKISFEDLLDRSINQVMIRTINTSVTTLFAIIAILIFGGDSLKTFIVTLLIGILAGTYSSVFIATPIMYLLDKKKRDGGSSGIETKLKKEEKKETKEKILV